MSIVRYDEIHEYLKQQTVPHIKSKAKILKLKGYSKLRKQDLIDLILRYFASIKIQRFLRDKFSTLEICLYSREPVKYPCWCKVATKTGHFFYYNLEPLVRYILTVGSKAKDPGLCSYYTQADIESIDNLYKSTNLPKKIGVKSIVAMLKKSGYYRNLTNTDEQIDIYIDLIKTAANGIKDRLQFYHDECYDVNMNVAIDNITTKIGYMRHNFNGLYRISKFWLLKSFKMIDQLIENIDFENDIKSQTLELFKKESEKFTF